MRSGSQGLKRAFALRFAVLGALCGLCACVAQPGRPGQAASTTSNQPVGQPTPVGSPAGRRIAVLLPLSGPSGELGRGLLRAVRLSLTSPPPAAFDEIDTKGTADGATEAARAAVAGGAGIFVGPLTSGETEAAAAIARPRGIPVLPLTSDASKGESGVWPMGITPGQQVRPLVAALRDANKGRIGALLPQNPFGDALAAGLVQSAVDVGLPAPKIVRYQPGTSGLESAISQLGGSPAEPPPVDAVLLGTTAEAAMAALPALSRAGLGPDRVRLLGTALWGRNTGQLAPLAGAWFAGPPQGAVRVFEQNYTAKYGQAPRELASVAFDAAAAAKAVSGPGGVDVNTLLNPSGFAGANGVFVLQPDGQVRRALMLFQITPTGLQPLGPSPGM